MQRRRIRVSMTALFIIGLLSSAYAADDAMVQWRRPTISKPIPESLRYRIQSSEIINQEEQNKPDGAVLNLLAKNESSNPQISPVQVKGTRFLVKKPDGSLATNEELKGAILVAYGKNGIREAYRIDNIETYSSPETGDINLYTFSTINPQTGQRVNPCEQDARGVRKGFPLSGYWDRQGNHIRSKDRYSITCTNSAIGKCVLMGYLPWRKTNTGESLWNYHQACVRLLRADYCGNGKPHTRDGTRIELWDEVNLQDDTSEPGMSFEAAWNEKGAVCVSKTRIPDDFPLEDIIEECPEKLKDHTGSRQCPESFDNPLVLILNRSAD